MKNSNLIYFEQNAEEMLLPILQKQPDYYVLCDENTARFCLPDFQKQFGKTDAEHLLIMPAGENHKNLDTACMIWEKLQQTEARRDSLLINLGGGTVCDLGGFVASTWKRGMHFINVPTTLMAQCDAAIGGKNGLDFGGLKNQIGLFRPADAVCIFPAFLQTLPERELKSGFAEMLKHGILADATYYRKLKNIRIFSEILQHPEWIRHSVDLKMRFVKKDVDEQNERRALNFGHSIGHAYEALFKGRLSHGEAIAHGMRAEALMAVEAGILPENDFKDIENTLLQLYGTLPQDDIDPKDFERCMRADKKRNRDTFPFAVPSAIGKWTLMNQ